MRPHDRSVRSKSSALARVRMHLTAGLGWIRGFPRAVRRGRVEWVSVPAPGTGRAIEVITVDRERLRVAALAHRKLMERERGALARVFVDVGEWSAGVERRLEALKAVIHHGAAIAGAPAMMQGAAPVVQRAARRAVAAQPGVQPLMEAFAWIHGGDARALGKAVRFAESRAAGLAGLMARDAGGSGSDGSDGADGSDGFWGAIRLGDLAAADGESLAAAPARAVCDPAAFTVPQQAPLRLADAVQRLFRKKGKRPALVWPDRPIPEIGPAMLAAIPRLVQLPDGDRRRALRLLALVTPRAALHRWTHWWRAADRAMEAVMRRMQPSMPEAGRVTELRRQHATLRRLERTAPPVVPMHLLTSSVLGLHGGGEGRGDTDARFLRELLRGVRAMPELQGAHGLRVGFFVHWVALHREAPRDRALLRRAMALTRGLLRGGRFPERVLFLWSHIAERRLPSSWDLNRSPEGLAVEGEVAPAHLPRLFRAVELAAWGDGTLAPVPIHDAERWSALLVLVESCGSPAQALEFLRAVVDAGEVERVDSVRRAVAGGLVACAGGDAHRWVELLRVADTGDADGLDELPELVAHTGQGELIGDWLLANERARVLAFAARYALVRALGAGRRVRLAGAPRRGTKSGTKSVTTKRAAGWMRRYPERLRPVLRELAGVSGEAEEQAGRVMGRAFPDPKALGREIDGLESRIALAVPAQVSAMRKRLESLRTRRASPADVSPVRLQRFEAKLAARVRDLTLSAWERELDRVAVPAIAERVGAALPPEWVSDPRRVRLLTQLAALEAPYRALAFRLVALRLGPEPWDCREHPANRRWLQRMQRRGLRTAPWIDGPALQVVEGPRGTEVTLVLATDPLEIFRMGEPFGTCLSPDDFNFFSTVANAADLNKRVLFAHDPAGRVVGRCLLAVSDDGHLLTFHAYAHDGDWDFAACVRQYAGALARAMATTLAPVGQVASLVAPDWYDDGPVDMTGRFRWSGHTSRFAKALPDMAPDELLPWVQRVTKSTTKSTTNSTTNSSPNSTPITTGLDTLTAPMLLGMGALRERPELVAALVPALAEVPNLSPDTLLDAVNLVIQASAGRTFGAESDPPHPRWLRPLVRRLVDHPFWRGGDNYWNEQRLIDACLISGLPADALRILRRTRPRGVRSWDQEFADARIYAAACGHDALHRPAVALRLFARLASQRYINCGDTVLQYCKRRAAELESLLSS